MAIVLMICGAFWTAFALLNRTQNFKSAVFFKIFPFFTGLATIICAMGLFGWLNV